MIIYLCKGWTPLMVAAREGYLAIVKILINYGANVNDKNKSGKNLYFMKNYIA